MDLKNWGIYRLRSFNSGDYQRCIDKEILVPRGILASNRSSEKLDSFCKSTGVIPIKSNLDLVKKCDVIF